MTANSNLVIVVIVDIALVAFIDVKGLLIAYWWLPNRYYLHTICGKIVC
jgi:hypothetical protein